jgi:hypothetical protein
VAIDKQIQLKATGETITFTKSTEDLVEMIVTLQASGDGPPTHRHVFQTEFFEAMEGKLGLDCADNKMVLEPDSLLPCLLIRFTVATQLMARR